MLRFLSGARRSAIAVAAFIALLAGCSDAPSQAVPDLPPFDSLVVTVSATLSVGRTVRPTLVLGSAEIGYIYQELPELASSVKLSSSNRAVVSIASDGSVHAIAPGHASITGELAGRTSTVNVEVIAGYDVTVLPGTDGYSVKGVNDAGAIIASIAGGTRFGGSDVLWQGGAATDLGACSANDINNTGKVACAIRTTSCQFCTAPGVFENGVLTTLFDVSGTATGVTESGAVFGQARDSAGFTRLFVWTSGAVTHPASSHTGWLGDSFRLNTGLHGVAVYSEGYPDSYIVGRLPYVWLPPAAGRWSQVRDINDADDAVGYSERMASPSGDVGGQATIWRAANNWKPENPSYRAGSAVAVSEAGQVIGNGRDGPWLWTPGRYTILNDALASKDWTLTSVAALSRGGIVAAQATNTAGMNSVVLIDLGKGK
jgi:hypothetical protein